jgi:hypothetical protein
MLNGRNSGVTIVGIVLFCLSTTFLGSVQEANYEALLGEWDVQTEDGQYAFVFIFSMEEKTLKGLFKGTSGEYEMKDLSFEGNELKFTVTIDAGGQTMSIDYNAAIEGDALEGYLSMEYGEANITGKKRK